MLAHSLWVGGIIYDIHGDWGIVEYFHSPENKEKVINLTEADSRVRIGFSLAYHDAEEDKWVEGDMYETYAYCAYPIAEGASFKGCLVCWEINADEFDADHDYDYYCPSLNENLWDFELD